MSEDVVRYCFCLTLKSNQLPCAEQHHGVDNHPVASSIPPGPKSEAYLCRFNFGVWEPGSSSFNDFTNWWFFFTEIYIPNLQKSRWNSRFFSKFYTIGLLAAPWWSALKHPRWGCTWACTVFQMDQVHQKMRLFFLKESDARLEMESLMYVVTCVSWQIRFVCMNQLSTHLYSRLSYLRSIPLQAGHL